MNSAVSRYGVALVAVAVAVILQRLLVPVLGNETPFLLSFAAVMFSAWNGGFGPGMLAAVLSAAATNYLFISPENQFTLTARAFTQISIFIAESAFISALSAARRRSGADLDRALARTEAALQQHRRVEREVLLLVEASGALLQSLEPSEVLEKILELANKFVLADAYAVWRLARGGDSWRLSDSRGL